jgi:hypothetical protein
MEVSDATQKLRNFCLLPSYTVSLSWFTCCQLVMLLPDIHLLINPVDQDTLI